MAKQQPWVVQFNGTSKPALVAPFDGCRSHEAEMAALQGKQCLGRDGNWSLMLDGLTRECSLMSFAGTSNSRSPTVISLPPLPLPEDNTQPSYIPFGCALSNQAPPDCTVTVDFVGEKSLLYCRPGDQEWSRLPVELAVEADGVFDGPITPGHQGKVYATTIVSVVAVDSSGPAPAVERTDIMLPPPCPVHDQYKCFPVPCPGSGELFLVRCCNFGFLGDLVDAKVFRWNQEDNVWETVESIGDRTFFVGRNSFAVPSTAEAGTQLNCVHVLRRVYGEYGIYTVSLDDMTISLSIIQGCDGEEETFWALPTSFGLKSGVTHTDDVSSDQVDQKRIEQYCQEEEKDKNIADERRWCDLHTDLLQLLVTKISFIDFLHVKAVCKHWNSITGPIHECKVSPLLMTTRPGGVSDLVEVYDPMSEKKYTIRIIMPDSGLRWQGSQLLHFTKNGWVIVSRGRDRMFFLVNPFKNYSDGGHVIALPPLDVLGLKGLSFSSVPGCPDFVVLAAGTTPDGRVVTINTWRIGDKDWKECLGSGDVPFLMASHSPVFLDGLFYFLDINGRLGVVDPNEEEMEWNALEKPDQPIRGSDRVHPREWDYNYLVEWKGQLIAVFREPGNGGSARMFKLDRSQMVWSELDGIEDVAVFWDRSNALIAMPPQGVDSCNKMFLPNYNETEDGVRNQAFYSFKEPQQYPSLCAKEPMNAIWFHPNLEDVIPLTKQ